MCQKILAARIKEGLIGPATIEPDVCSFEPTAEAKQKVKAMTAGFPCQVSRWNLNLKVSGVHFESPRHLVFGTLREPVKLAISEG